MSDIQAKIHFNDKGTPISEQFDDVYFSDAQGLAETQYVFLKHNQIPTRFEHFHNKTFYVAETGFGTGLNFIACWQAIDKYNQEYNANVKLKFLTFEKFPLAKGDLSQAYQAFDELSEYTEQISSHYPESFTSDLTIKLNEDVELEVILGDVNQRLPKLTLNETNKINAWFLDGFAPSKNPDMWTEQLFLQMARIAKPDCTVATFTAAGFVRRGLIAAGFEMKKHPGFGHKREMIAGQLTSPLNSAK